MNVVPDNPRKQGKDQNSTISDKLFETIFESASFGMALVSIDGHTLKVNNALCEMFGYSEEELLSLSFSDVTHLDDLDVGADQLKELIAGNQSSTSIGKRFIKKDGSEIWTNISYSLIRESTENQRYLLTIFQDITDQKRTHQLLENQVDQRTQELATLYEVTSVATESLDLNQVMEQSLRRILSVMDCEIGSIHLLEHNSNILHLATWHGTPEEVIPEIERVPLGQGVAGSVLNYEAPLVVPAIEMESSSVPSAIRILAGHSYIGAPMRVKGKPVGVLSIIGPAGRQFSKEETALLASIADQVAVAVENAQLYNQAETLAVVEERQRIAREIHDTLAQGFTGINLQLEAVESALEIGNQELVQKRLERARKLAEQSLTEARRSVWALRPKTLEEKHFCDALRDSITGLVAESDLQVFFDIQDNLPEIPIELQTDLLRVTQEAVMNVIKHAEAEKLDVRMKCTKNRIELQIKDDGRGFYMGESPSVNSDWSGFGITAMQERIDRHRGELIIESTPNSGTNISVKINLID